MYKAWISLGACFGLAWMIMVHVFNALEQQPGLDSQQALYRAEQSLSQICQKHGFSAKGIRLVDETPPASGQTVWRFEFNTADRDKFVAIEVDGQGQVRDASHSLRSANM